MSTIKKPISKIVYKKKYAFIVSNWSKLVSGETSSKNLVDKVISKLGICEKTYYNRVKKLLDLNYISNLDGLKSNVVGRAKYTSRPKIPKANRHFNRWRFDMSRFKNWDMQRTKLITFKKFIPSQQLLENNNKAVPMGKNGGWTKIDGYLDIGVWGRFYVLTSPKAITIHLPKVYADVVADLEIKSIHALEIAINKLSSILGVELYKDGWVNCEELTREVEITNTSIAKYVLDNKIKQDGSKYATMTDLEGFKDSHYDKSGGTTNVETDGVTADSQQLENFVNSHELLRASCGSEKKYNETLDFLRVKCGTDENFLESQSMLKNAQSEGVINIPKELTNLSNNDLGLAEAIKFVNNSVQELNTNVKMIKQTIEERFTDIVNLSNTSLKQSEAHTSQIDSLANATKNLAVATSNAQLNLSKLNEIAIKTNTSNVSDNFEATLDAYN